MQLSRVAVLIAINTEEERRAKVRAAVTNMNLFFPRQPDFSNLVRKKKFS